MSWVLRLVALNTIALVVTIPLAFGFEGLIMWNGHFRGGVAAGLMGLAGVYAVALGATWLAAWAWTVLTNPQ